MFLANLGNLFEGMTAAMNWIFGLFSSFIDKIVENDLLLYPVLLALVMGAVFLVIRIVRSFGMRSRRS